MLSGAITFICSFEADLLVNILVCCFNYHSIYIDEVCKKISLLIDTMDYHLEFINLKFRRNEKYMSKNKCICNRNSFTERHDKKCSLSVIKPKRGTIPFYFKTVDTNETLNKTPFIKGTIPYYFQTHLKSNKYPININEKGQSNQNQKQTVPCFRE